MRPLPAGGVVPSWSSERPQTCEPPALSEWSKGPSLVEAAGDGAGAFGGELLREGPAAWPPRGAMRPQRKSVTTLMALQGMSVEK